MINVKSHLTPKIDHILKLSNYEATPIYCTFPAQKSKCPRRFLGIDPEIWHVFYAPYPSLSRMGLFLFFSPDKLFGISQDPNFPKKYKTNNIWRNKKYIKKNDNGSDRAHKTRVPKIQGLSPKNKKRRGHWLLNNFWAVCLNQPVSTAY